MERDRLPFRIGRVFWDLTGWTYTENRLHRFLMIAGGFLILLLIELLLNSYGNEVINLYILGAMLVVVLWTAHSKSPTTRMESRIWVRRVALLFVGWVGATFLLWWYSINPPYVPPPAAVVSVPNPYPNVRQYPHCYIGGGRPAPLVREGDMVTVPVATWEYAPVWCMEVRPETTCFSGAPPGSVKIEGYDEARGIWRVGPGRLFRMIPTGTAPVTFRATYENRTACR